MKINNVIMSTRTIMPLGHFESAKPLRLPILSIQVPAGFPSPADDHIERKLDLNELMIKHPAATFFVRAHGNSMENAGIRSGDIMIVDRALEAADKCIVIAVVNGDLTVKRLRKIKDKTILMPENDACTPIELTSESEVTIWGVVTHVIHSFVQ